MKKVILFDAKYLLYRQHFAHKGLQAGMVPTGGMWGFWKEVLRMGEAWPGWSMVFCWDGMGPSWKTQTKDKTGYKGNRVETEDTRKVAQQEAILVRLLYEMGFHTPRLKHIEADDLIGVLTGDWKDAEVMIYSADRDMYQLVGPGVKILSPRKVKVSPNQPPEDLILDSAGVTSHFGVAPKYVTEIRAMCGDPADNLKGLPGIGPKKALLLFQTGVRPSRDWLQQPFGFRHEFPELKEHWDRLQEEYRMVVIPRSPNGKNFFEAQRDELENIKFIVCTYPERRKRDVEKSNGAWLRFLGQYEMNDLFAHRNKVWSIP
jgi:5'-3' exonuclease